MRRRSLLHDYFQAAVMAIIFALFVRTYLVQAFQIPTPSMEDTIYVGDHILVNKFAYGTRLGPAVKEILPLADVKRHDIIIFKFPQEPEKDYVKRVIGLPGETIKIEDGQVSVRSPGSSDWSELPENYALHKYPESTLPELNNLEATLVPEDEFFVMGDNRDDSRDSRDWNTVPRNLIRGKALLVYWSIDVPLVYEETPPPSFPKRLWNSVSRTFTRTRWNRTFLIFRHGQ